MAAKRLLVVLFGVGVLLGGCMQSTVEPASDANLTPVDRKLLANPPYARATNTRAIPASHCRNIPARKFPARS